MREIKFRAWDSNDRRFVQWDELLHYITTNGGLKGMQALLDRSQQHTGLTDKYGKEIYEGDIVSFRRSKTATSRCFVEWDGSGWYLKPSGPRRTIWSVYNRVKVIGNIYENPELLEAKQ